MAEEWDGEWRGEAEVDDTIDDGTLPEDDEDESEGPDEYGDGAVG